MTRGELVADDRSAAGLLVGVEPASTPAQIIGLVMSRVRHELGLELAWVSEFSDGQRVFRHTDGTERRFGVEIDAGDPLEETYCYRVVNGLLPNAIPDAQGLVETRDLDVTARRGIGAYIGVPVVLSDDRLYGTFCCLGSGPSPSLSARDVAFMRVAAALVAEQLEREERAGRDRAEVRRRTLAAIEEPGMYPVFQPIQDLGDGHVVGYEALSRFVHEPVRHPAAWFEDACAVQLGPQLELAAAASAIDQLGRIPAPAYLACNFSPASLFDDEVMDRLCAVPAGRLVVELTEHAPVASFDRLRARLADLRRAGIRIALDDVGAGYSTLHVLLELRPEIHKIDLSIVRGVYTDRDRRAMVAGLASFARTMGALVVAEGIENEDDRQVLWELGVPAGQGFHLGRPGPLPTVG